MTADGSGGVAGGLLGQASGTVKVSYSYAGGVTTKGEESVHGAAHAAGLIGQANGTGVSLEKAYSSAKAEGSDTGNLYTGDAHVSDAGISYGADDADETRLAEHPVMGMPYNAGLLTDGNGKYPYESLQDMIDDDSPAWIKDSKAEWIRNHVGDWPKAPSAGDPPAVIWGAGGTAFLDGKHTIRNDDVRYAWIKLEDYDGASSTTVTLLVSNINNALFLSKESERVTHTFTIAPDKSVSTAGGLTAEYRTTGPDGEAGDWLRVVLDDITAPGQRFHDLFPTLNPALEVRVRAGSADRTSATRWTGTDASASKPNVAYVLYDITSGASEAVISNIRHLQNLDPSVSHVGETVKTAKLVKDLDWTEGDSWNWNTKSIRLDGNNVATSFYGIENANLTKFDGQNHTLRNFVANRKADAATAPDANAGLFRKLTGVAQNLKLDNFTVEARANGNAGVLAAQTEGSAEIDTVLAISDGKSGATVTGKNAGGLVGAASGGLKIANSAATVIVRGADTSGGLVGAASAQLAIEDSYAGGHTSGGRYATASADSYNIQGGAAGGLVGNVSGGSLKAEQSFSAASVSSADGAAGGGLIGAIASGVSAKLESVYVVAPVDGVSAGATGEFKTGAVAGVAPQITNAKTFYLPELYKGYSLANGVRTSGTPDIFSDAVKLAYYDRSDESNQIAARSHDDTMEIKTYPYDTEGLKTSDGVTFREYPFSIWTTFTFDNRNTRTENGEKTYGVYYGDWQPILPRPTVNHNLHFLYRDPLDGQVKPVSGDENLIHQKIQEGKDNKTLLPYLAHMPGQRLAGWYLTDAGGQPVVENVSFTENNGYITIEAPYCGTDRYVTALFEKDPNEYAVSFVYDPSGQNRYSGDDASFERIGRVVAIDANNANIVTVPSRSVDGYLFKGWYANAELTEAATFSIANYKMTIPAASSKRDYTFYAKYEKPEYEFVTVDFMYQTEDGALEAISSVPVFQPEDVSQYQIQVLKGQGYSGWVKLPANLNAYTPVSLLNADNILVGNAFTQDASRIAQAGTEGRFRNDNQEVYIDTGADGATHYVMLYKRDGMAGNVIRYNLDFVLGDNAAVRQPETLSFPKNVTPRPNLSADVFKAEGYHPTGYSSAVNADGQTGVITVTYAPQSYMLSFNTGDGSYIPAKSVPMGASLAAYMPSETPTQTGYVFGGWEKLYKTGDESAVLNGGANATMPAYNVEAKAKWNPANVNYTVLFWYENPNDDNESYMGSVTRSAPTGSEVSGSSFSNYPSMSHTHSVSCYPGASSTYVTSSNIQNPSTTNGDVRQGKGTRYSANRYIYINGRWYLYTGSASVGSNAPHEGENYDWIDRTHFYHDASNVETKIVNGDGSTVLNVHFKRNLYTFTLKDGNTTLTTFTAKYQ